MPGFDVQRIIAAHQAGLQVKERRDAAERAAEDRKFEMEKQKHELQRMKLADKQAAREEAMQQFSMMQGQPGQEFEGFKLSPTPGGAREDDAIPEGRPAAPTFTADLPGLNELNKIVPHAPVTIPGVMGPDVTLQPQTMQDLLKQQRSKKIEEKQIDESFAAPTVIGEGAMATGGRLGDQVIVNPKDTPRPTEGEVGRGLSSAWYRDKHKLEPGPLTQRQQAEAEAEYDAYKKSLSKDTSAQDLRATIADQMEFQRKTEREGRIRDDYRARVATSLMPKLEAYKTIQSIRPELEANKDKNLGGSDILLVYNFIKLNDPNAVREGELALAQTSQTVPDQWVNTAKRYAGISGNLFGPQGRKTMLDAVDKSVERFLKPEIESINSDYRKIAEADKVNPDNLNLLRLTGGGSAPASANPYRQKK